MCNVSVSVALLGLQTAGFADRETLLVIFVGVIALFFLVLIVALLGGAIYAMRLKKQLLASVEAIKRSALAKATPIVNQAHGLVSEFTPKVRSITDDVVEIGHTVRAQVTDIDSTLSHVTASARSQADRVNGMVSSTLNTTSHVAQSLENGIRVPIREVSGLLAGLKAGLDVLSGRTSPPAKGRMRHAEEHLGDWEEDIAAEARKAREVNRPTTPNEGGIGGTSSVRTTRSVVQAGEEIVTGAHGAGGGAAVAGHSDQVQERLPD